MKQARSLLLILGISLILIGCGTKSATFGTGDTKLKVELADSSYTLSGDVAKEVSLRGNLKLKLANQGQKELPFVLTEDLGGVIIEFRSDDIKDANQKFLAVVTATIPITSDEGFINLAPGTSPTYSFSFSNGIVNPAKQGVGKEAFENAVVYFIMGSEKFKLNGKSDLRTSEEIKEKIKQEAGLSDDEIKSILTEVGEKARLDECPQGTPNDLPCLYAAWGLAFKQYVPQGKEGVCDFVNKEEIKEVCKSSLPKTVQELEAKFNELKS